MVVGAVIAPGATARLTASDMPVGYDVALLIVQSLKARQCGDLASRTKLFIKGAERLCIASYSQLLVCVYVLVVGVCVSMLVVGNASMILFVGKFAVVLVR